MPRPCYPAPVARRWIAVSLALCCAVPVPVRAAPNAPVEATAARRRGQALADEERWLEAAGMLVKSLEHTPRDAAHRELRNQVVSEALTAYMLAFQGAPKDCAPLIAGLAQADKYLQELRDAYGRAAALADDHGQVAGLRVELEKLRVSSECEAPAPVKSVETSPPSKGLESASQPVTPEGPSEDVAQSGEEAPQKQETRSDGARGSRAVPLTIAVGASAGLALSMMLGAVILHTQVRKPDGWRYAAIYEAAEESGVLKPEGGDMCALGAGMAAIDDACDTWRAGRAGSVAMGALASVFVVSTGVLTGLLIREQRSRGKVARAWRRHGVQVGASPRVGGAGLTAGFRF